MNHEILIVGENSLLKYKLASILSRSRRVYQCYTVNDAEQILSHTNVDCTIFCDYYFEDLRYNASLKNTGHQVFLASYDLFQVCYDAPRTGNVMQILYDQLYGFSGYGASEIDIASATHSKRMRIHPVLVDDIAFWLSQNMDRAGLFHLRGSETLRPSTFLQAISGEETTYEVLPESDVNQNWLGAIIPLRHTLAQGMEVIRHQRACAVNLIYKLPLHAPLKDTTVESFRERLGSLAALRIPEALRKKLDYICPVPNSGIPYAKGAAAASGLPLVYAMEKSTQARSFHIEDDEIRNNFIAETMRIDSEKIKGARICLVDEAIFTGSTLKILCQTIRSYGAEEIHVLIPTPPCTKTCEYCSIPTRAMLLETISREELEQHLGVDSVIFQEKEMIEAVIQSTTMTCCDCFA